jgi:hypothetical protein
MAETGGLADVEALCQQIVVPLQILKARIIGGPEGGVECLAEPT